jgi:hypothetical protein
MSSGPHFPLLQKEEVGLDVFPCHPLLLAFQASGSISLPHSVNPTTAVLQLPFRDLTPALDSIYCFSAPPKASFPAASNSSLGWVLVVHACNSSYLGG